MTSFVWIILVLVVRFSNCYGQELYGNGVCPQPQCEGKPHIPPDCRKNQFTIGLDNKTRCPACDASFCGPERVVCPLADCPIWFEPIFVPVECRISSYAIGSDEITKCNMCPVNSCGDPNIVCPKISCQPVPKKCQVKQFTIGTDGITVCPACDKSNCTGNYQNDVYGTDGCQEPHCQNKPYIPLDCRKNQFTIGSDGKTRCRTCDASSCDPNSCPTKNCSGQQNILKECRQPTFMIGGDGITKCRMCDVNACGDPKRVCPKIKCPSKPRIPTHCVVKQFTIGSDGITLCPACDKKNCRQRQKKNQNY